MKIIKSTRTAIQTAAQIVENGGVVVYPTDTVYGLGCNPFKEDAVKRIFKIKGERNKQEVLPVGRAAQGPDGTSDAPVRHGDMYGLWRLLMG